MHDLISLFAYSFQIIPFESKTTTCEKRVLCLSSILTSQFDTNNPKFHPRFDLLCPDSPLLVPHFDYYLVIENYDCKV